MLAVITGFILMSHIVNERLKAKNS